MRGRTGPTGRLAFAAAVLVGVLAGCSPPPDPTPKPAPTPTVADPTSWASKVSASTDDVTLAGDGLQIPDGANVFAARIFAGADAPAYTFFGAGGGGFTDQFYPASSIKLLAALGALDFARSLGFTGQAVVDGGYTIKDYYDSALRWSSNEDYDELVRIAGVDRLNQEFLPEQGYYNTVIQDPYAEDDGVAYSPEMTLTEGDHEVVVPARDSTFYDEGCVHGNCSTLFDMTDALRRVVLDAEIPTSDRFDVSPDDIAGLQDALAGAEGFIGDGVADAIGPDAVVYTKPGWVPELDCVETSLVVDPTTGHRFLLGLSAPDDGTCEELSTMAHDVLVLLDSCDDGTAMRADGSRVGITDDRQSGAPLAAGPATLACHLR